ncbi:uncharacterized protein PV09_02626 [Verruconis gallopava]|uniref:PrsW family intramembrane metalloprotease n=1 Tax=Verruconis gallopava TaxID=253628 RepID=A0A0D1Z217_9PEZI|nr:uncharacterized protein PV09_02626 [Verruconis gallopava]KIW06967.1 hypothetical protein PV09_02626 [Verruconis gallopava]
MMAQLLIAPVIIAPAAGLLWYNSRQNAQDDQVPTSFLLKTWALSGFLGPTIAAPVQLAIGWPFAKLLLGDRFDIYLKEMGRTEQSLKTLDRETLAARREIAFSLANFAGNVFMSTIAPLVEEILKYAALRIVEKYFPEKARTKRNYVLIAMAAGLGFALAENLAFISQGSSGETQARLALTIIERGIAGTSGHFLTAALTGCKFAESRASDGRRTGIWSIIKESLLYHGLGNFGLFTISTLYGNVGWVHPRDPVGIGAMLAVVLSVNAMAAWSLVRNLNKMDDATRKKSS